MITVFILELSAGISGYVLRNEAHDMLDANLRHTMKEYGNNKTDYITKIWDEVQRDVCIKHFLFSYNNLIIFYSSNAVV